MRPSFHIREENCTCILLETLIPCITLLCFSHWYILWFHKSCKNSLLETERRKQKCLPKKAISVQLWRDDAGNSEQEDTPFQHLSMASLEVSKMKSKEWSCIYLSGSCCNLLSSDQRPHTETFLLKQIMGKINRS